MDLAGVTLRRHPIGLGISSLGQPLPSLDRCRVPVSPETMGRDGSVGRDFGKSPAAASAHSSVQCIDVALRGEDPVRVYCDPRSVSVLEVLDEPEVAAPPWPRAHPDESDNDSFRQPIDRGSTFVARGGSTSLVCHKACSVLRRSFGRWLGQAVLADCPSDAGRGEPLRLTAVLWSPDTVLSERSSGPAALAALRANTEKMGIGSLPVAAACCATFGSDVLLPRHHRRPVTRSANRNRSIREGPPSRVGDFRR